MGLFFFGFEEDVHLGGLEYVFPYIGKVIIPIDELISFKGVGIPPTSHDVSGMFFPGFEKKID